MCTTILRYKLIKVHSLPLINSPAYVWTTLTIALLQLHKLNQLMRADDRSKNKGLTLGWFAMDLYKNAQTLFSRPSVPRQYLGPFHIVLCSLWCLQATFESSGLDVAWTEFGLYTVIQILCKW